jgi:hypothetical protein
MNNRRVIDVRVLPFKQFCGFDHRSGDGVGLLDGAAVERCTEGYGRASSDEDYVGRWGDEGGWPSCSADRHGRLCACETYRRVT